MGDLVADANQVYTVRERRGFARSLQRGDPVSRQVIDIRRNLGKAVLRGDCYATVGHVNEDRGIFHIVNAYARAAILAPCGFVMPSGQ